jgi:hypothetical protein
MVVRTSWVDVEFVAVIIADGKRIVGMTAADLEGCC